MRRNDVASTSFRCCVPTRFLINQCQIITLFILKYDIIENSRIELRGIVLPVQVGGLLGGGAKGYVGPPSQINGGGGGGLAPPLPTPMCYRGGIYLRNDLQFIMYFIICKKIGITCIIYPIAFRKAKIVYK